MDILLDDVGNKLIEWMEILKGQKVDKVFLYTLGINKYARKVIDYYR